MKYGTSVAQLTTINAESAEFAGISWLCGLGVFCVLRRDGVLKSVLVNRIRFVKSEGRDFDVEVVSILGDHLIRSAHQAAGRLERTSGCVLK